MLAQLSRVTLSNSITREDTTFDLTGWSLQYAASNGSGWGSNKQPLGGTIAPGQYYLIKFASGANGDSITSVKR